MGKMRYYRNILKIKWMHIWNSFIFKLENWFNCDLSWFELSLAGLPIYPQKESGRFYSYEDYMKFYNAHVGFKNRLSCTRLDKFPSKETDMMKTKKVLVLSLDQARRSLVEAFVSMFQNPQLLREEIESGRIFGLIPDFSRLPPEKVAALYAEYCLGEILLQEDESIDLVLIQTGDYKYEFGAQREQTTPGHALSPLTTTEALTGMKNAGLI